MFSDQPTKCVGLYDLGGNAQVQHRIHSAVEPDGIFFSGDSNTGRERFNISLRVHVVVPEAHAFGYGNSERGQRIEKPFWFGNSSECDYRASAHLIQRHLLRILIYTVDASDDAE